MQVRAIHFVLDDPEARGDAIGFGQERAIAIGKIAEGLECPEADMGRIPERFDHRIRRRTHLKLATVLENAPDLVHKRDYWCAPVPGVGPDAKGDVLHEVKGYHPVRHVIGERNRLETKVADVVRLGRRWPDDVDTNVSPLVATTAKINDHLLFSQKLTSEIDV